MKRISFGLTALAGLALAGTACKKDEPPKEPVVVAQGAAAEKMLTPTPAAAPATGTAAIHGTVTLTGAPPEMQLTKRDADPFCARTPMKEEEVVVGANGVLKNVIIRITKGITGNYEPPATSVTLDQQQCMYRPRVAVVMAGQPLLVRNSD